MPYENKPYSDLDTTGSENRVNGMWEGYAVEEIEEVITEEVPEMVQENEEVEVI